MRYTILVRYRTNSGCNAKTVIIDADDIDQAFQIASDKVSSMRGVIGIDGGECAVGCDGIPVQFCDEFYPPR